MTTAGSLDILALVSPSEAMGLLIALLSFLVSLLTLYNAARLGSGILAVSTYAFGAGMLSLAGGFVLLSLPEWLVGSSFDMSGMISVYRGLFLVGFILLGFGSFKIFQMSNLK